MSIIVTVKSPMEPYLYWRWQTVLDSPLLIFRMYRRCSGFCVTIICVLWSSQWVSRWILEDEHYCNSQITHGTEPQRKYDYLPWGYISFKDANRKNCWMLVATRQLNWKGNWKAKCYKLGDNWINLCIIWFWIPPKFLAFIYWKAGNGLQLRIESYFSAFHWGMKCRENYI